MPPSKIRTRPERDPTESVKVPTAAEIATKAATEQGLRGAPGKGAWGLFGRIYTEVRRIPPGSVTTYGEIARQVGLHNGARTVGWALASLPDGEAVPWWRVVRSDGTIANREFAAEQRKRLGREGVRFARSGGIDLVRYGFPSGTLKGR